jgi:serine/threonine-protein kinase
MAEGEAIKPGDLVDGKYRIDQLIGQGGMGVVLAATDIRLQRRVAMKVLRAEFLADGTWGARFLREARSAVQLTSEHSVRIHEVGALDDGRPFMVMEFLVGRDLGALVEMEGRLSLWDAVEYLLQACEAVADAHANGIIHRDIKPANLFLTRRNDKTPLIKVLDFGLAKAPATVGESLTSDSTVFGSPQYMSPEQLKGAAHVDARTDIWALGTTLYELLAGKPPFEATTVPELGAMIMRDPVTPVHVRYPDIPRGISEIILRCLEKEPARRYANVGDLASALEPYARPQARGSADRVRRVLEDTAVAPTERTPEPRAIHVPSGYAQRVHSPSGQTAPLPPGITATDAVIDTGSLRASRRRSWLVVAGLVLVFLVVAPLSFFVLRGMRPPSAVTAGSESASTPPAEASSASGVPAPKAARTSASAANPPPSTNPAAAANDSRPPKVAPLGDPREPIRPRATPTLPPHRLPTVHTNGTSESSEGPKANPAASY